MGEPGEPGQKGRQVRSPHGLWPLTPDPTPDHSPCTRAGWDHTQASLFSLHRETLASKAPLDSQDPRQVPYLGLGWGKGSGGRSVWGSFPPYPWGCPEPSPVAKGEKRLYSLRVTPKRRIQPDPSSIKRVFRTHIGLPGMAQPLCTPSRLGLGCPSHLSLQGSTASADMPLVTHCLFLLPLGCARLQGREGKL